MIKQMAFYFFICTMIYDEYETISYLMQM